MVHISIRNNEMLVWLKTVRRIRFNDCHKVIGIRNDQLEIKKPLVCQQ